MGQRGMYYYTALTVPRKPCKLLACCDYELTMSSVAACPHNQHDSAMTTLYTGSHYTQDYTHLNCDIMSQEM